MGYLVFDPSLHICCPALNNDVVFVFLTVGAYSAVHLSQPEGRNAGLYQRIYFLYGCVTGVRFHHPHIYLSLSHLILLYLHFCYVI